MLKYFLVALLLLQTQTIAAKDLFAILVGDTQDQTVGLAASKDIAHIEAMIEMVAIETDLKLHKVLLSGENVISQNLFKIINTLPVTSEDIVLFYFSGHGFRTKAKEGIFPYIYLGVEKKGVDLLSISKKIQSKHPKLFLAFVDCCNNFIPYFPPVSKEIQALGVEKAKTMGFRTLFLNYSGHLMISSANPGEYSWCTKEGSYATDSFLKALNEEIIKGHHANWQDLLTKSAQYLLSCQLDQHMVYDENLQLIENAPLK